MFDNNFQLISISILIISCIYLFYVNFVNIRDLNNIGRELNEIKINHTLLINQLKSLKSDIDSKCSENVVPNQDKLNYEGETDEKFDDINLDDIENLNHIDFSEGEQSDEQFILNRMNGVDVEEEFIENENVENDNVGNDNVENDNVGKSNKEENLNTLDRYFNNDEGQANNADDADDVDGDNNQITPNQDNKETNLVEDSNELDLDIDLDDMDVSLISNETNFLNDISTTNSQINQDEDMDLDLDITINELTDNSPNDNLPGNNGINNFDNSKINESTVKELKVMCKNLNISTRGNKTELINRINSHLKTS